MMQLSIHATFQDRDAVAAYLRPIYSPSTAEAIAKYDEDFLHLLRLQQKPDRDSNAVLHPSGHIILMEHRGYEMRRQENSL